jgi:hypothetical protein
MMPQGGGLALGVAARRTGIVPTVAKIEAKGRFDRQVSAPGRATFIAADGGGRWIEVTGWLAGDLPERLQDPCFEPPEGDGSRWRLAHAGGACGFVAAGVVLIEPAPRLLEPLGAPFALKTGERRAVRVLLALLRLPGGPRLLRAWHARRS